MLMFERIQKLLMLLFFIFFIGGLASCETDPFPEILLPVHPDAVSIKKMIDQPAKGAKAVAYHVSVKFPATKIVNFYNRELESMGYSPLNTTIESRPLGMWSSFNSRPGMFEETAKPPGLYIAHWVDNAKKTWVWLAISYKYDGSDSSWETNALVSCNIAKYSSYEEAVKVKKIMEDKAHNK